MRTDNRGWIITRETETTGSNPIKDLPEDIVLTYERLLTAEGTDAEILLTWAEALNKYDFWQDAQSTVADILEANEDPALELRAAQIWAVALEHLGDPRVEAAKDLVANLQEISRITEEFGANGTAILGALRNAVPKLKAPICFDPGQIPSWDPVWNARPTATAQLGTLVQCISAASQLRQQLMPNLGE